MKKILSICRNQDFRRIYAKGKSFVGPLAVTYVRSNKTMSTRVGITTSKKVGNAVLRNRCRRVIREAYRQLSPWVKPGYDLVFVARGRTPYVKSTEVEKQLKKQLQAAGVLRAGAQEPSEKAARAKAGERR